MSQFMQQNAVYLFIGTLMLWMLWQRVLAPRLSGVISLSAPDYMQLRDAPHSLVDVRQPGEWRSVRAVSAIHIPLGEISNRMHEIPRERPVVLICASGARSAMAATALAKAGFSEVYNFSGGMGAWSGAGLPIQTGG